VVEEDLVEAADQDQGFAPGIERIEGTPCGPAGGLDSAVERGSSGRGAAPEEDHQQDTDLPEAQAHCRGGDSELVPLGGWEVDRMSEPAPELGVVVAKLLILRHQLGTSRALGILGLDGGVDLAGMVVDGLAATAGLTGTTGDIAAGAGQGGRGVGDPGEQRELGQGSRPSGDAGRVDSPPRKEPALCSVKPVAR
jgi:hypothetical protein